VENWSCAKLGFLNGRISGYAFEKVDQELWRFVDRTLEPADIAKAAS
jgi:hypothetical protein